MASQCEAPTCDAVDALRVGLVLARLRGAVRQLPPESQPAYVLAIEQYAAARDLFDRGMRQVLPWAQRSTEAMFARADVCDRLQLLESELLPKCDFSRGFSHELLQQLESTIAYIEAHTIPSEPREEEIRDAFLMRGRAAREIPGGGVLGHGTEDDVGYRDLSSDGTATYTTHVEWSGNRLHRRRKKRQPSDDEAIEAVRVHGPCTARALRPRVTLQTKRLAPTLARLAREGRLRAEKRGRTTIYSVTAGNGSRNDDKK